MPSSHPLPETYSRAQSLSLDGVTVVVEGRAVLDIPQLLIAAGAHVGISGVSGSGKTTLLQVMAGLRRPSTGRVQWGATDISALTPRAGDAWRRSTIGLVFQDYQLIPELSALENVLLPCRFVAWRLPDSMSTSAAALLAAMGIDAVDQRVSALSRGEQQRVAMARALLHRPALILADEPTASLDADNGAAVIDHLVDGARANQATLVVVSHDPRVLARLDQTMSMQGGKLADGVALK